MSDTTALPPGLPADRPTPYDDTLALNDIHALLTSPSLAEGTGEALQAIMRILARTGRSPYLSRTITATVEDRPHGIPVARVDSEGTIVTIDQDPNGPGIRIGITPRDPADEASLVIAIGDKIIHRARQAGLHLVPHLNGGQP